MEIDKPSSLQKKYYRLPDLAKGWNLDVAELLNYAIDGVLHVAIEEFRGASFNGGDDSEGACEYPSWAVFLIPDVLKKIALHQVVTVAGGMRAAPWGLQPVFFPERRITADDLIVLPHSLSTLPNPLAEGNPPSDQPLSLASRNTLLKQIAALAVLLSKQHEKFAWGDKPNSKAIGDAIGKALAQWPSNEWSKLETDFFSKTKITDSIRDGLKLIGFEKDKPNP